MTWPASDVDTTKTDSPTDVGDLAAFRSVAADLIAKMNLIRNHAPVFIQTLLGRANAALARTDLGSTTVGDAVFVAASKSAARGTIDVGVLDQNSQSANYTCVLSDANKHIFHPSADTTARTFTIPANSSVPYEIGTVLTFVNQNAAGNITIAITTDTLRFVVSGVVGGRTLIANGIATALKVSATEWLFCGSGVS